MSDLELATKTPNIPALDGVKDENVRAVLAAMKEILEVREGRRPRGDQLDSGVTFRDLFKVGLASVNVNGEIVFNDNIDNSLVKPVASGSSNTTTTNTLIDSGSVAPDLTIPNAPTGLEASGTKFSIIVEWDQPTSTNHSYMEIWRNTVDNLGTAAFIGRQSSFVYADIIGAVDQTRFYWIRAVSKADITGVFNAIAGVSATTSGVNSGDIISLDGAKIIDATIVNAKISSVAASKITTGRLSATESIDIGTGANRVTIDGLGNVRMGQTGYATSTGIFIGEHAGLPKASFGSLTNYFRFNGVNLEVNTPQFTLNGGNAVFSGAINAASYNSGAFTEYAWPASNGTGVHLSPSGLLLGNPGLGKYLQITQDGNFYSPALDMVNGVSNFKGPLIATGNILNNAVTSTGVASYQGNASLSFGYSQITSAVINVVSNSRIVFFIEVDGTQSLYHINSRAYALGGNEYLLTENGVGIAYYNTLQNTQPDDSDAHSYFDGGSTVRTNHVHTTGLSGNVSYGLIAKKYNSTGLVYTGIVTNVRIIMMEFKR